MCELIGILIGKQVDEVGLVGMNQLNFSTDNPPSSGNDNKDKPALKMGVRFILGIQILLKKKPLSMTFPAVLQKAPRRTLTATRLLFRILKPILRIVAMLSSINGVALQLRGGGYHFGAGEPRRISRGSAEIRYSSGLVFEQNKVFRGGGHGKRVAGKC